VRLATTSGASLRLVVSTKSGAFSLVGERLPAATFDDASAAPSLALFVATSLAERDAEFAADAALRRAGASTYRR
jgi:hypothetical protein